jgi:uncharacterized protein with PIN domain
MKHAVFLFFDELNNLLPPPHRSTRIPVAFQGNQTVKHLIESLGVPHTEVDTILVNERPVDFSYQVEDQEEIHVFPVFSKPPVTSTQPLNGSSDTQPRFILDIHLGKLARYLRMLGFDTWYDNTYDDLQLARLANQYERILLTRDRRLLMRSIVTAGYCIRELDPEGQLVEVIKRFSLAKDIAPFKRCIRCNALLEPVRKEEILDRLQPLTRKFFDEFHICPDCKQIYWKGSHYDRMQLFIQHSLDEWNQQGS